VFWASKIPGRSRRSFNEDGCCLRKAPGISKNKLAIELLEH